MREMVHHPQHYQREGRKECIVEMEEKFGTYAVSIFCLLNAYKYLYRAGLKQGTSKKQDLEKAEWYYTWTGEQNIKDLQKEMEIISDHPLALINNIYEEIRKQIDD